MLGSLQTTLHVLVCAARVQYDSIGSAKSVIWTPSVYTKSWRTSPSQQKCRIPTMCYNMIQVCKDPVMCSMSAGYHQCITSVDDTPTILSKCVRSTIAKACL
ncbi:hypothetical protein CEXT_231431 [Caerostris extrusa]|uniref:Secreted protein n=1 Tax=Caerostris extrusa TaxID=172846 RepID=A0AAV4QNK8_CAEEX|nr:hypothetical protein CEXT_231431 [Caerostris extrusa]